MAEPSTGFAQVAIDGLEVGPRSDGLDDGARFQPAELSVGEPVWVIDISQQADETWLLVAADRGVDEFAIPFGWIPTRVDGDSTLGPSVVDCPELPLEVPQALHLGTFGGLACYGTADVELIGFTPLGCGAGGSPRVGSPEWLNGTWTRVGIGDAEPQPPDFVVDSAIYARAGPTTSLSGGCGRPGWFRFLGHFDDPASATCRTESSDGARVIQLDPRLSQLLCRSSLVITDALPLDGPP